MHGNSKIYRRIAGLTRNLVVVVLFLLSIFASSHPCIAVAVRRLKIYNIAHKSYKTGVIWPYLLS